MVKRKRKSCSDSEDPPPEKSPPVKMRPKKSSSSSSLSSSKSVTKRTNQVKQTPSAGAAAPPPPKKSQKSSSSKTNCTMKDQGKKKEAKETASSSSSSSFDHLTEAEKSIVIGFRSPAKKRKAEASSPSKPQPLKSLNKEALVKAPTSEKIVSSVSPPPSKRTVPKPKCSVSHSPYKSTPTSSNKSLSRTLTTASKPAAPSSSSCSSPLSSSSDCSVLMEVDKAGKKVYINPFRQSTFPSTPSTPTSSNQSMSQTLTPSSTPSASSSSSLSSSASDSSILMEVKKSGKLFFINPFLSSTSTSPSPPSPPGNQIKTPSSSKSESVLESQSVIVIEDSPQPHLPKPNSILTSTPFPSMGAPVFTFPSDQSVVGQDNNLYETEDEDDLMEGTNLEEEDMELDEEVTIITLNDARENTMLLQTETLGILTKTVADLSTTVIETRPETEKVSKIVLVIDTNVFISALSCVKDALNHHLSLNGQLFVLLPWAVLQELDYLKQRNQNLAIQCRAAVRYINNELNSKNPQLLSQSPQQAAERLIPVESNDDKILVCCLQRMNANQKDRVILVTRDINLSSKALVAGIETSSNTDLWRKLLPENAKEVPSTSTVSTATVSLPQSYTQVTRQPESKPQSQPEPKQQPCNNPLLKQPPHSSSSIQTRAKAQLCHPAMSQQRPHPYSHPPRHFSIQTHTNTHHNRLAIHQQKPPPPHELLRQPLAHSSIDQPQLGHQWRPQAATQLHPHQHPSYGSQSHLRQDLQIRRDVVANRFTRVWNLIFHICGRMESDTPSYNNRSLLVDVLRRSLTLYKQFERCLDLAPTLIRDHGPLFIGLNYTLNHFTDCLYIPNYQPNQWTTGSDLACFFEDTDNRPQLFSCLKQLGDVLNYHWDVISTGGCR